MNELKIKIDIDTRERKKYEFRNYFLAKNNAQIKKKTNTPIYEVNLTALPVGDFVITYNEKQIVIERKEITDFFSSLFDNRLQIQTQNMINDFGAENSYLIIEGDFARARYWIKNSNFPLYMGTIIHYQKKGMKVLTVSSIANTKYTIHLLAQTLYKDPSPARIRVKKPAIDEVEKYRKYLLAGLPQLGEKRVKEIMQKYNTVGEFFESLKDISITDSKLYQTWKKIVWGLDK